jgi:hypothetical protein
MSREKKTFEWRSSKSSSTQRFRSSRRESRNAWLSPETAERWKAAGSESMPLKLNSGSETADGVEELRESFCCDENSSQCPEWDRRHISDTATSLVLNVSCFITPPSGEAGDFGRKRRT